jgi:glycosyltransferase involved in cell wall biosynthesis
VPEDDTLFLNVGRYTPPKAQLDLIKGFSRHASETSDTHLIIVGWGPLESKLRVRCQACSISDRVTITGKVPDVEPFYKIADVFVSSSKREGLPFVLLEAMASKLPIIGTDIRGVREVIIESETGVLVPSESPESLGEAITEANEKPTLWRTYGRQGYQRAMDTFSIETVVAKHLNLYRELAQGESS